MIIWVMMEACRRWGWLRKVPMLHFQFIVNWSIEHPHHLCVNCPIPACPLRSALPSIALINMSQSSPVSGGGGLQRQGFHETLSNQYSWETVTLASTHTVT